MRRASIVVLVLALAFTATADRVRGQIPGGLSSSEFSDWYAHIEAGWRAVDRGLLDVAEKEFGAAIVKARPSLKGDPRLLARSYNDLAWVLRSQGRAAEAEPLAEWALSVRETKSGPNAAPVARTLALLALIDADLGRPDRAEARLERALKIHETLSGKSSTPAAEALVDLAGMRIARRKFGQARTALERVLAMPPEAVAPEDRVRALAHAGLADVDEALGDVPSAIDHLERAYAATVKDPWADPKFVAGLKARLEALRRAPPKPKEEKSARPPTVARQKENRAEIRAIAASVERFVPSLDAEGAGASKKAAGPAAVGDGGRSASGTPTPPLGPPSMPLRQTAQAGSFAAAATWSGGVVPAPGDTLSISHAVAWTPAANTSFTLGTGTGAAVTFGTGGKLTLTPAGPFVLTLAGSTAGGNTTSPEFVASSPNGTLTINIDATANASGFAMIAGGNYSVTNGGGWTLTGNATYPIEVASLPADGTKNSWFTNGGTGGGGNIAASYVTFRRLGVASTTDAFAPSLDNRQRSLNWSNVTLDSCGEVSLSGDSNYTGAVNLTDVKSVNTLANGTSAHPLFATFGATGPRTFTRCVWDKSVKFVHARGCSFVACYFHNGWLGTDVTSTWAGMDGCFIRQTFDSLITSGSVTNSFLYWDGPSGANPHFLVGTTNPAGATTFNWNNNVAYYNGTDAAGNVFLTPATTNAALAYNINGNLILPNRAGANTGALVTSNNAVAGGFSLTANRNTVFVAGQHGFEIGHLYPANVETPNRYVSVKSNLFIGGGTGYKALNVDASALLDVMPPATVNHNGSYQIKTTSGNSSFTNEGRGYASKFSATPGANDVDGQDPAFVNPAASLAAWAETRGSSASTTLGREADALTEIRADPTRIASLVSWIRAAYAPTNPAYKGTAHDGGDIGAVPVLSPPRTTARTMVGADLFACVF